MKRRNGSKKLRWESEKDLRISLVSFGEAKRKEDMVGVLPKRRILMQHGKLQENQEHEDVHHYT